MFEVRRPKEISLKGGILLSGDFFRFVAEMLERHRDDANVMSACGHGVLRSPDDCPDTFAFVQMPVIWGWARRRGGEETVFATSNGAGVTRSVESKQSADGRQLGPSSLG